jgi:macrolide transport system ATP-binding/permease protein
VLEPCRVLARRVAALFRRSRLDEDLDAELQAHLDLAVDANLRAGMSPEDARREALRGFGGVLRTKELCRDERGLPMIETALQDLRFGLRMLRRHPGFSVLALLCLTLGIGANAAVFSWIEGVLFRPFPLVADQDRLFAVTGTNRGEAGLSGVSWPDFVDLGRRCTLVDAFIADKITGATLGVGGRAQHATGSIVSANYFDAIGVRPVLGRGFLPSEDEGRNAHAVVVISYQLWKERFDGDPDIVGKIQPLDGLPHTIVGVAPQGFYGTFVGYAFQFWVPVSMQPTSTTGRTSWRTAGRAGSKGTSVPGAG